MPGVPSAQGRDPLFDVPRMRDVMHLLSRQEHLVAQSVEPRAELPLRDILEPWPTPTGKQETFLNRSLKRIPNDG